MTTIAYRAGVMAGDRRCDAHGTWSADMLKIRRVSGWLLGVCGLAVHIDEIETIVAARIESGKPMKGVIGTAEYHRDDGMSGGLLVSPDGQVFKIEMDKNGKVAAAAKQGAFFADGSGMDFAYGAMEMGASAEQAVRIAGARDAHTGETVDTLELAALSVPDVSGGDDSCSQGAGESLDTTVPEAGKRAEREPLYASDGQRLPFTVDADTSQDERDALRWGYAGGSCNVPRSADHLPEHQRAAWLWAYDFARDPTGIGPELGVPYGSEPAAPSTDTLSGGEEDTGCPKDDPGCFGGEADCHDACERPTRAAPASKPSLPEGFIPWEGGECPLNIYGETVEVHFRHGRTQTILLPQYDNRWKWDERNHNAADIIAYRVIADSSADEGTGESQSGSAGLRTEQTNALQQAQEAMQMAREEV